MIGFDCKNPSGWTLRTYLEFENRTLPGIGVAVADYRLAATRPGPTGSSKWTRAASP